MDVLQATSSAGTPFNATHATPRLAAAAQQFESVLLGQWLQDAESTFAAVPGSDDADAGKEQMQGFATQQLAIAFTASGGIGIAKLVLHGLKDASAREQSGASAATAPVVTTSAVAGTAMQAYHAESLR